MFYLIMSFLTGVALLWIADLHTKKYKRQAAEALGALVEIHKEIVGPVRAEKTLHKAA